MILPKCVTRDLEKMKEPDGTFKFVYADGTKSDIVYRDKTEALKELIKSYEEDIRIANFMGVGGLVFGIPVALALIDTGGGYIAGGIVGAGITALVTYNVYKNRITQRIRNALQRIDTHF